MNKYNKYYNKLYKYTILIYLCNTILIYEKKSLILKAVLFEIVDFFCLRIVCKSFPHFNVLPICMISVQ